MWRELTKLEIDEYEQDIKNGNKIVVTHVGDGEYDFNVFGNVFSSLAAGKQVVEKAYSGSECIIVTSDTYNGDMMGKRNDGIDIQLLYYAFARNYLLDKTARITIETIDSRFNCGG